MQDAVLPLLLRPNNVPTSQVCHSDFKVLTSHVVEQWPGKALSPCRGRSRSSYWLASLTHWGALCAEGNVDVSMEGVDNESWLRSWDQTTDHGMCYSPLHLKAFVEMETESTSSWMLSNWEGWEEKACSPKLCHSILITIFEVEFIIPISHMRMLSHREIK
jgi:hypothetical protein